MLRNCRVLSSHVTTSLNRLSGAVIPSTRSARTSDVQPAQDESPWCVIGKRPWCVLGKLFLESVLGRCSRVLEWCPWCVLGKRSWVVFGSVYGVFLVFRITVLVSSQTSRSEEKEYMKGRNCLYLCSRNTSLTKCT